MNMKNLLKKFALNLGMVGALLLVGGAIIHPAFGAFNPTGGSTYYLQSSISATQTTVTLTSFTEPVSNIKYTMSYLNSDIEYATINPETNRSEFISFTGITQNSNGTALLTGVTRGLERSYPYNGSSTLAVAAPGQTKFILSSPPQFFNEYAAKRNTQTVSGAWTFTTLPTSNVECTSGSQFCNRDYINAQATAGAPSAGYVIPGIGIIATGLKAASTTASTTFNAITYPNFISAANSTSTSNGVVSALKVIVTNNAGKISQTFLDIFSTVNTWTGNNIFTRIGIGTSTPYAALSVVDSSPAVFGTIYATSTAAGNATSTFDGNLRVVKNATTTNLTISGTCRGCTNGYEQVTGNSGTCALSSWTTCTATASCSAGKVVMSGGYTLSAGIVNASFVQSYPPNNSSWTTQYSCGGANCAAQTITTYATCINP